MCTKRCAHNWIPLLSYGKLAKNLHGTGIVMCTKCKKVTGCTLSLNYPFSLDDELVKLVREEDISCE